MHNLCAQLNLKVLAYCQREAKLGRGWPHSLRGGRTLNLTGSFELSAQFIKVKLCAQVAITLASHDSIIYFIFNGTIANINTYICKLLMSRNYTLYFVRKPTSFFNWKISLPVVSCFIRLPPFFSWICFNSN